MDLLSGTPTIYQDPPMTSFVAMTTGTGTSTTGLKRYYLS